MREAIDARSGHCLRSTRRKVLVWLVLGGLAGCVAPAWDAEQLEARHPELRRHPGQRLADVRPYYWPQHDQLTLFLCRWSRAEPIPVAIAADATEPERRAVHAALAAWEGAGLGVSFARVERLVGRGIEFEFVAGMLSWAASTVAECAVDGEPSAAPGAALDAGMVAASIQLGRNDPRLVGSALHELGHALGFQGHPRRGDSIMLRDAKRLLATSVRVGRGGDFSDATLAALYALPSGTVLARLPLPTGRSAVLDRLAEIASQQGWRGPRLQVGDNAARIGWHDADGAWVFVRITGLRAALEDPGKLVIEAGESAARWLD